MLWADCQLPVPWAWHAWTARQACIPPLTGLKLALGQLFACPGPEAPALLPVSQACQPQRLVAEGAVLVGLQAELVSHGAQA